MYEPCLSAGVRNHSLLDLNTVKTASLLPEYINFVYLDLKLILKEKRRIFFFLKEHWLKSRHI